MKLLLVLLILIINTFVNGQFVLLNYYNIQDQQCNNEIISTSYYRQSTCMDGTEYVCTNDNNNIQFNYYSNSNCTGDIFQQDIIQNGECKGALQSTCVDNYQLVENSIITVMSNSCDDWKDSAYSILSRPLNKCIINPSESGMTFSCTDSTITTSTYPTTFGCSGEPTNYTLPTPQCNSDLNYFYTFICNQ